MIRVGKESDREKLEEYLKEEVYGRAIWSVLESNGIEGMAQTLYVDETPAAEGAEIQGVYLWLGTNLLLYVKNNQIAVDFVEETMGIAAPEWVAGRKDNVNIVSWLLTDYKMETGRNLPPAADGQTECINPAEHSGEWAVLTR